MFGSDHLLLTIAMIITVVVIICIYLRIVLKHRQYVKRCSLLVRAFVCDVDSLTKQATLKLEIQGTPYVVTTSLRGTNYGDGEYIDIRCNPQNVDELYIPEVNSKYKSNLHALFSLGGIAIVSEFLLMLVGFLFEH